MKEIDWEAVLESLEDELRDNMRMERQCDPDDERNPYTFQTFYLREKIGLIEKATMKKPTGCFVRNTARNSLKSSCYDSHVEGRTFVLRCTFLS